ncbi:MAG: transcriptional initiation protein Tat [Haloquadratum sp.]
MERPRRAVLRRGAGIAAALLGGCLGTAPRATGPRHAPDAPAGQPRQTPRRPTLTIGTFDFEATDGGRLRVFGTIANHGPVQRTATVRVTVTVDGDESVRETSVTVGPDATAEWTLTVDVAYEAFTRNGSLSVVLGS